MRLYASLLVITSLLIVGLLHSLFRLLGNRELRDASPQHTTLRNQTALLTVTLLFLGLTTLWLISLQKRIDSRMELLTLKQSVILNGFIRSETMASLLNENPSCKPTLITTTTSMYLKIYGNSATIVTPSLTAQFGIKPESVPSLISFAEEHGLECNTRLIETEDGILLTSATLYDFVGLLQRLRPWLIPLGSDLKDGNEPETGRG